MQRVAFLSFDWDYQIVSEYYLGLQERLKDYNDVQVVVFNAFGSYYVSHQPRASSFEVFSLFDSTEYDGVLIQGNRTWPPELRQKLVDEVVALDKPVVSINYDLEGAHSVGTNNYQEEYELVYRVLRERGCQRPAFVNGLKTSVEAQERARGFNDACEQLGVKDVRFYQANWQRDAGVVTAKKMLRKRNDLPDVVFCCNDDLADGIQETFQDAGVRVPDDVMITGFDNRAISQRALPRITTVDRDYRTIAATALDLLKRLMSGEDAPQRVYSPARLIFAESCRYARRTSAGQSDASARSGVGSATADSREHFFEVLEDFQSVILDAESLYAILEDCEVYANELDCSNAFISLDSAFMASSAPNDVHTYGPTSLLVARKGRSASMRCDGRHVYASYDTRSILPSDVPITQPILLVSPLRHNETCVGTIVTEGVPTAIRHGFNAFFLTVLSSAIVAAKTSELLQEANARL